jgi:hypothetical protein
MSKAEAVFKEKAPVIMRRLMKDLPLTSYDAAAIVGNAGHECLGFTVMQEIKPVVAGSRGGYGWFQWTGPRRRAFEAYCAHNKLDINSDEANYCFLIHELQTTERRALPALTKAVGLRNKVIAFEDAFERAGVKAYDSRVRWASLALETFEAQPAPKPVPTPVPPIPEFKPAPAPAPAPVPSQVNEAASIARWVMGAIALIAAAFSAWLMKG